MYNMNDNLVETLAVYHAYEIQSWHARSLTFDSSLPLVNDTVTIVDNFGQLHFLYHRLVKAICIWEFMLQYKQSFFPQLKYKISLSKTQCHIFQTVIYLTQKMEDEVYTVAKGSMADEISLTKRVNVSRHLATQVEFDER